MYYHKHILLPEPRFFEFSTELFLLDHVGTGLFSVLDLGLHDSVKKDELS